MKKFKYNFSLVETLVCVAIIGLLTAVAIPAMADETTQSFNATNEIDVSVAIVSDPTNSSGILTGTAIPIRDYDKLGFYIKGSNATANASAFTVKLTKGVSSGTPVATASARDYETVPSITITVTTPAAAGRYCYYTNLGADLVGSATTIGIASITNATASASFTFADFGISKKIIPIRFP